VIPAENYKVERPLPLRICQHLLEELKETVRLRFLVAVFQSSEDSNLCLHVHLILDKVRISP